MQERTQTIQILHGDCKTRMRAMEEGTGRAIITDPPYLISFMGKKWDQSSPKSLDVLESESFDEIESSEEEDDSDVVLDKAAINANQQWHEDWLKEAFRVLKPGGIIKSFSATRTFHRLAAAMEKVGFILEPGKSLEAWVYACLSEDTEILTSEGWVQYHKAKVGTPVIGFDLETGQLSWQHVEETYEYPYDYDAYHICGPGTDQIVSHGHRCVVQRNGQWVFVFSEDLQESETMPCLPEDFYKFQSNMQPSMRGESPYHSNDETPVRTERTISQLHNLQNTQMVSGRLDKKRNSTADMLQEMQWGASGSGLGETCLQSSSSKDPGNKSIRYSENDRSTQSSLERGSDIFQETRELCPAWADQVHPLSSRVSANGPQRRIHHGTSFDCCQSVGEMPVSTGDSSSYEPQPNRQQAGKSSSICIEQGSQTVRTSWDTTAHLARVVAKVEKIHYTGKVWCVKVPTGAFVARRNGMVFVTGNSGFPKSRNVFKSDLLPAITKQLEIQNVIIPKDNKWDGNKETITTTYEVDLYGKKFSIGQDIDGKFMLPYDIKKWEGFGTALKPAWEPFIVGKKPVTVEDLVELEFDGHRKARMLVRE